MADYNREIDASGLNCPLPILRARKTLVDMERGQILKIISTDAGSVKDFEAFSKQTNNPILSSAEEGEKFIFYMQKS